MPGAWLRDAPLAEAQGWYEKRPADLNDNESAFISRSLKAARRRRQQRHRVYASSISRRQLRRASNELHALVAEGSACPRRAYPRFSVGPRRDRPSAAISNEPYRWA
ncbi:MAG: hypothetical protein ACREYE_19555 [Gammaproteobacteria bacterium]